MTTKRILNDLLDRYPELAESLAGIEELFFRLKVVFSSGGKLLICGNGGSASDAQHIVGELMKDFTINRGIPSDEAQQLCQMFPDGSGRNLSEKLTGALPAISLSGEDALNSALANDVSGDLIYAQQVYGLCTASDAVLGLSTSGNSANVVNAVKTAKLKGAVTLAITGAKESGLSSLCDVTLRLPSTETYQVQEYTLPVYHALCRMLEMDFWG